MDLEAPLQQALSDLAEVRDRLAKLQRFQGYSGIAATASGIVALLAGALQQQIIPSPHARSSVDTYLMLWLTCLAGALALNYGAVVIWLLKHRGPRAESQFRTAALSIAPSILLGGALSAALAHHGTYSLLPGTWFACYAVGLFASRDTIPKAAMAVTFGFAALALAFLVSPLESRALEWWVMPLGFGFGQIAIGCMVWKHDE